MRKVWIGIVVIVAVLVIAFIITQTKQEPDEIKIGAILPLTGDGAIYGSALKKGMDLALASVNDNGGIDGKKLSIIYEDSQLDPKVAVAAANKLIFVDKVPLVVGCMFSSTTLAIVPVAEKSKVVLLSPTASAEAVPNTGPYVFSIYPSDAYDGMFLAEFVTRMLKKHKAAIISVQADAMQVFSQAFSRTFKKLGGRIVFEEYYAPGTDDFRSVLTKLSSVNPDVVCLPGYLEEIAKILRQAREIGLKSKMVTISTAFDEKILALAGDAAEGLLMSAPFYDPEAKRAQVIKFRNSYEQLYGEIPNVWAAYGYDVVGIAAAAFANREQHGTAIRDELSKIRDFPGLTGKTSFLENGGVEKTLRVMTIHEGEFLEYE